MFLYHRTVTESELNVVVFFSSMLPSFEIGTSKTSTSMNLSAKKKALNLKRTYVGYCNLLILPLETPSNLHSLGDPWSIVPYASLRLRSKRPV